VVEFSKSDAGFWESGTGESFLGIDCGEFGAEGRVLYVDVVWIRVLRNVIDLLGLLPHKTVSCRDVAQVEPGEIVSGEQILF